MEGYGNSNNLELHQTVGNVCTHRRAQRHARGVSHRESSRSKVVRVESGDDIVASHEFQMPTERRSMLDVATSLEMTTKIKQSIDMTFVFSLLEGPLAVLLHDLNAPLLVQTSPARFEDRTSSDGVLQCGQTHFVQIIQCLAAFFESLDAVDELFEAHVAVATLASEVTLLVCGVFHVL